MTSLSLQPTGALTSADSCLSFFYENPGSFARRGFLFALPISVLLGCLPASTDTQGPGDTQVPETKTPAIVSFKAVCNVEQDRWVIDLFADAWTSGGMLLWTADGAYFEAHNMRSIAAEPDGSGDQLRLNLDIAGDWREAVPGESTALRCSQEINLLLAITDETDEIVDCVTDGSDASKFSDHEEVAACFNL